MSHRTAAVPAPRSSFAGFRFPPEVIILALRWYLRYSLSYRDVEELLAERGITVEHLTIYRWVQRFTGVDRRSPAKPARRRGSPPGSNGARPTVVTTHRDGERHRSPGGHDRPFGSPRCTGTVGLLPVRRPGRTIGLQLRQLRQIRHRRRGGCETPSPGVGPGIAEKDPGAAPVVTDQNRLHESPHDVDSATAAGRLVRGSPPHAVVHDLDADASGLGPKGQLDSAVPIRRRIGVIDTVLAASFTASTTSSTASPERTSGASQRRTSARIGASWPASAGQLR